MLKDISKNVISSQVGGEYLRGAVALNRGTVIEWFHSNETDSLKVMLTGLREYLEDENYSFDITEEFETLCQIGLNYNIQHVKMIEGGNGFAIDLPGIIIAVVFGEAIAIKKGNGVVKPF